MATAIFRDYDRAALDREYDNRAKVPEFADYLTRWARESARARAELPCRLDVPYGPSPAETLDVFRPPPGAGGRVPVQVFLHGGYWRALDKADFSFVARAAQPAATVVPNYGLIPAVDMDELVRQCRAAVAWVYRNAETFGGDPGRLFVSGHSAGGHLCAMLLATDWPAFDRLPADLIKGGCGISGLYDLEPIRLCFLNETLKLAPDTVRRHSPVHLVPRAPAPLLLPVGALEGSEYHRQTADLAAAWRRLGVACDVMDLAGHHHFSIVSELEEPSRPLTRALRRQMGLA